jgi:hypothetical protein
MSKRYKVCVIDEEAHKEQCMEIETSGVPMEALASLISGVLAGFSKLFGAHHAPPKAP